MGGGGGFDYLGKKRNLERADNVVLLECICLLHHISAHWVISSYQMDKYLDFFQVVKSEVSDKRKANKN